MGPAGDGFFDCADSDCSGAPDCQDGSGDDEGEADDDDDDDDDTGEAVASVFLCNNLTWSGGNSLRVELSCDGVHWIADSGECTECKDLVPGVADCEFAFDGVDRGSFSPEIDDGDEFAFLFTVANSDLAIHRVEADCGTALEDM